MRNIATLAMKRFQMITEADARVLEYGSSVMLVAGGHVTPLAADTLKARRIALVREGADVDAEMLAPRADIRTVAIAGDHTSLTLKDAIIAHLRGRGLAVHDLGTNTSEPVDYPDTAGAVALQVARGEADAGIAIDGAGLGSTIAAQQAARRARRQVHRPHAGALRAGAQRRQRPGARVDARDHAGRAGDRRHVPGDADARSALYPAAREGPRSRAPPAELMPPLDVQRLIQIIVEELAATAALPVPTRCACHSLLYECCPDRLRGVLDAGATRLGLHATGGAPGGVASMIDHTLLKPDATRKDIEALCREAAEYKFASVCVNPTWVALCAPLLQGSGVRVCSVVGFPLGATTADTKHYETRRAIFDGAREIDMVINVGALKSGDLRVVERDIEAVTVPCRGRGAEQGDHRGGAADR